MCAIIMFSHCAYICATLEEDFKNDNEKWRYMNRGKMYKNSYF